MAPAAPGVNLTFVQGDPHNFGTYPAMFSGFPRQTEQPGFTPHHNKLVNSPSGFRAPYRAFPKITDLLKDLDKQYNDPPRDFSQYADVLSNVNRLGFGRIHEVIMAASKAKSLGGDWLKIQIEHMHIVC